jgi:hypothetical protein
VRDIYVLATDTLRHEVHSDFKVDLCEQLLRFQKVCCLHARASYTYCAVEF